MKNFHFIRGTIRPRIWLIIFCCAGLLFLLVSSLFSTTQYTQPSKSPSAPSSSAIGQSPPADFTVQSRKKLADLQTQIQALKKLGVNTASYEAHVHTYQLALGRTITLEGAQELLIDLDTEKKRVQTESMRTIARTHVQQFQQEVARWAKEHPYHNAYDGQDYALNNAYMSPGIGGALQQALTNGRTLSSFNELIVASNDALFLHQLLEADALDKTAYDQPHISDLQLLQRYGLQEKQVIVISLAEQVLRVYQHGNLQRAAYVTTGRQELPSLPGVWSMLDRKTNVTFQAGVAENSAYWFPNTPIKYAMLYHLGGYFIHDASWRGSLGPGTQFPHQDAEGNTPFNENGSHGCINMADADAAWLYQHSNDETAIAIY